MQGWTGPSLTKTLPVSLPDFTVSASVTMESGKTKRGSNKRGSIAIMDSRGGVMSIMVGEDGNNRWKNSVCSTSCSRDVGVRKDGDTVFFLITKKGSRLKIIVDETVYRDIESPLIDLSKVVLKQSGNEYPPQFTVTFDNVRISGSCVDDDFNPKNDLKGRDPTTKGTVSGMDEFGNIIWAQADYCTYADKDAFQGITLTREEGMTQVQLGERLTETQINNLHKKGMYSESPESVKELIGAKIAADVPENHRSIGTYVMEGRCRDKDNDGEYETVDIRPIKCPPGTGGCKEGKCSKESWFKVISSAAVNEIVDEVTNLPENFGNGVAVTLFTNDILRWYYKLDETQNAIHQSKSGMYYAGYAWGRVASAIIALHVAAAAIPNIGAHLITAYTVAGSAGNPILIQLGIIAEIADVAATGYFGYALGGQIYEGYSTNQWKVEEMIDTSVEIVGTLGAGDLIETGVGKGLGKVLGAGDLPETTIQRVPKHKPLMVDPPKKGTPSAGPYIQLQAPLRPKGELLGPEQFPGLTKEYAAYLRYLKKEHPDILSENWRTFGRSPEGIVNADEWYLINAWKAKAEFGNNLDQFMVTDPLTLDMYTKKLTKRHKIAVGIETGHGYSAGNYHSLDEAIVHPGKTRNQIPEQNVVYTSSSPETFSGATEWLKSQGFPPRGDFVLIKGMPELLESKGTPYNYQRAGFDGVIPFNAPSVKGDSGKHYYPVNHQVGLYLELAHKQFVEVIELMKRNAPQDKILIAVADYYHTVINGHLFSRVNNSLLMGEINIILKRIGLKEVTHGKLDLYAIGIDYPEFRTYFAQFIQQAQ